MFGTADVRHNCIRRVAVQNDASNAWTMLGEIVLLKKCTLESHYR